MSDTVRCPVHGETKPTHVCEHLAKSRFGLGFNHDEPDSENPYPDAWCDDCELIREAHGGWNEESEKLATISLLCARCYELARIRNTHPETTLADLEQLRWKCSTCDEWHTGACLDFGYSWPFYWTKEHGQNNLADVLGTDAAKGHAHTFLNEDFCVIEGKHFFVRGVIHLPIVGTDETFRWGVWGSLSEPNFNQLIEMNDDPKRIDLPPMFSWLSSQIKDYPDSLSLKMYAHIQALHDRPLFELEPADHQLAREYHHGITPERVKEIMLGRLRSK